MPPDPAEPERRGGLVLLAGDRADGAARGLRHLGAAPEDQPDPGRGQRRELERLADRRQREEDDEDRHDDRQATPHLDVHADRPRDRPEPDRQEGPEQDPEHESAEQRDRRELERASQALLEHVVRDGVDPVGHQRASGRARWPSSRRIPADIVHTSAR